MRIIVSEPIPLSREISLINPDQDVSILECLNTLLDRLPSLRVSILGCRVSSWQAWVKTGLLLGISLFLVQTIQVGENLFIGAMIVALNCTAMLLIQRVSEHFIGYFRAVLLEHFVPILALNMLAFRIGNLPMGTYLDRWIMGVSLFIMVGRLGCLSSGCCHGRPAVWGTRYAWLVWKGAPPGLGEVRLLPVQMFESLLAAFLLSAELLLYYAPHQPGEILGVFLAGYAAGRFGLEFLRGDERPYFLGLSEAQWTVMGLILSMGLAPLVIPLIGTATWFRLLAGSLGLILLFSVLGRRRLGGPPILSLSRKNLTEIDQAIRHGSDMATATLRSGQERQFTFLATTDSGLTVRLEACAKGGVLVQEISLRGRHGQLDSGSAMIAALVVRKVFPEALCNQPQTNKSAPACFRIETVKV